MPLPTLTILKDAATIATAFFGLVGLFFETRGEQPRGMTRARWFVLAGLLVSLALSLMAEQESARQEVATAKAAKAQSDALLRRTSATLEAANATLREQQRAVSMLRAPRLDVEFVLPCDSDKRFESLCAFADQGPPIRQIPRSVDYPGRGEISALRLTVLRRSPMRFERPGTGDLVLSSAHFGRLDVTVERRAGVRYLDVQGALVVESNAGGLTSLSDVQNTFIFLSTRGAQSFNDLDVAWVTLAVENGSGLILQDLPRVSYGKDRYWRCHVAPQARQSYRCD